MATCFCLACRSAVEGICSILGVAGPLDEGAAGGKGREPPYVGLGGAGLEDWRLEAAAAACCCGGVGGKGDLGSGGFDDPFTRSSAALAALDRLSSVLRFGSDRDAEVVAASPPRPVPRSKRGGAPRSSNSRF